MRSQCQASARYMPCAAFSPSECTSVMNINMAASFIVLVMPNSLAALIELIVSPPGFARPRIFACEVWAWSKNEPKSEALKGCLTLPSTLPPSALMTSLASFSSEVPNA